MVYYFGTPDQVKADEAYERQDYYTALSHYHRALETLNRYAAQPHFHPPSSFYDAVCYVNVEIAHTQCMVILSSMENERFSLQETEALWQQIRGKIPEILQVFNRIKNHSHVKCNQEFIDDLLRLVSETCEQVSDELLDLQDNESSIAARLALLEASKSWIAEAIHYRHQAGLRSIEQHLGYLNILESLFKLNANRETVTEMLSTIENSQLLTMELPITQTLEVYYYQALAAFELQNEDCAVFLDRCQQLLEGLDSSASELVVVEETKSLINRYKRYNPASEERDEMDDSDFDSDRMDDTGFSAPSSEYQSDSPSTSSQGSLSVTLWGLATAATTVASASHSPSPAPQNQANAWLFFQPPTESATTMRVMAAMRSITDTAQNEKFFANLLSIVGDYFYRHCQVKFKNRMLMAHDLYSAALAIDPDHHVAKANQYHVRHFPDVRDNLRFASKGDRHQDSRSAFLEAIEEVCLQLDVLALQHKAPILEEMIESVAATIESKNIAGQVSAQVADTLRQHFNRTTHQPIAYSAH
ncbi:hypothetical protein [Legionella erythra]|uniref:Uncharacterized protein n=1 Tax=Legionella erythra TaxID=448 RepID=A0A0W0TUM2_LEGER|nr:hypothetical protein [Legionella erythra]KTC99348.1 hypothetical protein Lery_0249 [Legionella erythra]